MYSKNYGIMAFCKEVVELDHYWSCTDFLLSVYISHLNGPPINRSEVQANDAISRGDERKEVVTYRRTDRWTTK